MFESREISVTTKAPESVFRFHKCQGHPLVPLRGAAGTFYIVDVLPDITHEALDAVGRQRALPKLVEEAKSVERESVLQPLLKGARRLPIDLLKLGVEIGEPFFCGLVRRFLISPLKFPTPRFLVGLRQITDYVLALVPLASLDLGALAEYLIDSLAKPLAPVDDAKNAFLEIESTPNKAPQQFPRPARPALSSLA